jgi:hypothetical protein
MAHQDDDNRAACNAVMISKKNATFLRRLYDAYQSFDSNCWDCHSVRLPGLLASIYPKEIVLLPTQTFFRPSWNEYRELYELNNYNFDENYASHLWNKASKKYLQNLTPKIALHTRNTVGRMIRRAVSNSTLIELMKTTMILSHY